MKCADEDCRHYLCGGCGTDICPDLWPSPGEPDLCAECWNLEADDA